MPRSRSCFGPAGVLLITMSPAARASALALLVLLAVVPAARARLSMSLMEDNPFEVARYSGQRRQLLVSLTKAHTASPLHRHTPLHRVRLHVRW